MSVVSGDIIEVTVNHPTLGAKTFRVKSAEDSTYDIGGQRSADEANGIDGTGGMIDTMNRVRPFFEVMAVWDMVIGKELEFAQQLQSSPVLGDWTITHINGSVHGLTGKPVGDLNGNGNAGTFTLKVAGQGTMKQIV